MLVTERYKAWRVVYMLEGLDKLRHILIAACSQGRIYRLLTDSCGYADRAVAYVLVVNCDTRHNCRPHKSRRRMKIRLFLRTICL